MASLPAPLKAVLLAQAAQMSSSATTTIRNADAQAYARMKASKISYDPTEGDRKEWTDVFVKVAKSLRGTVFTPAIFDKVVQIAQPPVQL
jgi:hypothetical protein